MAYRKKYYEENREKINASNKAWNKAHPEVILANTRRWQEKNPEKTKQIYRNWVKNNPNKRRITRKQSNHKRKAIIRGSSVQDCREKIALLNRERFCRWCCTALNDSNRTIDHIIPLARSGHHIPDNLAACCKRCNFSRGDKLIHEWLPDLKAA